MSKKKWYVFARRNPSDIGYVHYCQNKKEAEAALKEVVKTTNNLYSWIDFVWKADVKKGTPFHMLHGKNISQVSSLPELLSM